MVEATTHVGLDVHKESISVAMLLPGSVKAVQWEMRNEAGKVRRLVRRVRRDAGGGLVLRGEPGVDLVPRRQGFLPGGLREALSRPPAWRPAAEPTSRARAGCYVQKQFVFTQME